MNLKCLFGHDWDGCKCSKCGKARDEGHDWAKDCEKCSRCGEARQNVHQWDSCKCSKCGKTRDEGHDWAKDCEKCSRCGKTRNNVHNWSKDCEQCALCGMTRAKPHNWSYDCEKCLFCGKTRTNVHTWDGCKCSKCGRPKAGDEHHDWSKDCEKCAFCGKERQAHNWDGFKCTRCGFVVSGVAKGDRVRISKYLGCWNVTINGITREIHFKPGHIGTILRPQMGSCVVVSMDAQEWKENLCGGHSSAVVSLPSFELGINVASLERAREGIVYVGTSSYQSYHGVTNIKIELLDGGDAIKYEDGGKNGYYSPLGNKLVWKQNGAAIWIGMFYGDKAPVPPIGFNGSIEGDYIRGTEVSSDGKQKWDWVLKREKGANDNTRQIDDIVPEQGYRKTKRSTHGAYCPLCERPMKEIVRAIYSCDRCEIAYGALTSEYLTESAAIAERCKKAGFRVVTTDKNNFKIDCL
jgi:hypothetical protein